MSKFRVHYIFTRYIYIYTQSKSIHTHTHTHIYIYICVCVCVWMCICVCVYLCVYTCVNIYIHICIYIYRERERKLKNKLIQREELNVKDCQRFNVSVLLNHHLNKERLISNDVKSPMDI